MSGFSFIKSRFKVSSEYPFISPWWQSNVCKVLFCFLTEYGLMKTTEYYFFISKDSNNNNET